MLDRTPFSFPIIYIGILSCYALIVIYVLGYLDSPQAVLVDLDNSHQCISQRIYGMSHDEVWIKFPTIVNSCSSIKLLDMKGYSNMDETKYHVLMNHETETSVCTVVSLGIGKDISAEQQLKKDQPHCVFHGADPVAEVNAELYGKIGTFHHIAVGGRNGTFSASVLDGDTWDYRNRTVPFKGIHSFLRHDVQQALIDHIMIDIEYAEYTLLHKLLRGGRPNEVVICQINIEIHAGNREQRRIFVDFIRNLLNEREYVPLRANTMLGHIRLYLLNAGNSICRERYLRKY